MSWVGKVLLHWALGQKIFPLNLVTTHTVKTITLFAETKYHYFPL